MTSSKYGWKHWTVSFPIYLWMFCSLWHLNCKLLFRSFCIFSCSLHCLWKENPEGHAERVLMTNWCVMDMKSILWLLVVFLKIFLMGVLLHVILDQPKIFPIHLLYSNLFSTSVHVVDLSPLLFVDGTAVRETSWWQEIYGGLWMSLGCVY